MRDGQVFGRRSIVCGGSPLRCPLLLQARRYTPPATGRAGVRLIVTANMGACLQADARQAIGAHAEKPSTPLARRNAQGRVSPGKPPFIRPTARRHRRAADPGRCLRAPSVYLLPRGDLIFRSVLPLSQSACEY